MDFVPKPKPGYKLVKSLFGKYEEIPEEWEYGILSHLCEKEKDIVAGPFGSNLIVDDYREQGIPIIRLQNIERNQFVEKNIRFIEKKKAEELQYHSYQPNDLVLAKLGDPIGKTCKIPSEFPSGIVVADVVRIRPSKQKANLGFVEYVLNSNICEKQLNKERIGTTRPRVNLEQIRNLLFPIPPIHEQQKIASILSSVDDLIKKYDEIITQTRRLKQGLMQQLLTKGIGHKKIKKVKWLFGKEIEIPEEWEYVKLIENCSKKPEYGAGESAIQKDDNLPRYIRITDVNEDGSLRDDEWKSITYESGNEYLLNEGDILFARTGATVGKSYLYDKKDGKCAFAGYLIRFIPDQTKLNSKFLFHIVHSSNYWKWLKSIQTWGVQPNVNAEQYSSMPLLLPPIHEQQKIAFILSSVDDKISELESKNKSLESLKKGLMQKLLTGQIRVKV